MPSSLYSGGQSGGRGREREGRNDCEPTQLCIVYSVHNITIDLYLQLDKFKQYSYCFSVIDREYTHTTCYPPGQGAME